MNLVFCVIRVVSVLATHQIQNEWIELQLIDDSSRGFAGSIWSFHDKYSGKYLANQYFPFSCVQCGEYTPASGLVVASDTSAVFASTGMTGPGGYLPVGVTISYTLVDRGVEILYRLEFLDEVELVDPLEVVFNTCGWATATIENQTGLDETFPLNASTWFQRFSGSQLLRLTGGSRPPLLFVFPNVSKGILWIEDYGQPAISMRFFDTEAPRENCSGPDLHSVIPAGAVREYFVRLSLDEYFAPLFISNHPHGYQRSAAWMLDELPFIHPQYGYIWGYSETSDGPEPVAASLIRLLEEHPTLKMDWLILPDGILTANRDSVWFEPGLEWSWSHWHGTWRVSTESTEEYRQWLRNIQDQVYPWSGRVTMGSHGYHHTPNADSSFAEFHEFITYEPWEHGERFRMVMQDLDAIGLDTTLVNVIRFPGHRTSLSGLWAIIEHGFGFYCNGWRLTDWYAGKQFRNQWISMYETPDGRIWGSNTVWWGDFSTAYPYVYLSDVLDRGKFALLGCHPAPMLNGGSCPVAYARIDSVITSLEQDYENFGWLLPAEYGDYLEACYSITVRTMRNDGGLLTMEFEGAVPAGMTFCASLDPSDQVNRVTIDGVAIPWDLRSGGRLFAVSGALDDASHVFQVEIDQLNSEPRLSAGFSRALTVPNPSFSSAIVLSITGEDPIAPVPVRVFDMTGRLVFAVQAVFQSGTAVISPMRALPSGLYWVSAQVDGEFLAARTVLLN